MAAMAASANGGNGGWRGGCRYRRRIGDKWRIISVKK